MGLKEEEAGLHVAAPHQGGLKGAPWGYLEDPRHSEMCSGGEEDSLCYSLSIKFEKEKLRAEDNMLQKRLSANQSFVLSFKTFYVEFNYLFKL